jgi:uncharacterized protein YkwD
LKVTGRITTSQSSATITSSSHKIPSTSTEISASSGVTSIQKPSSLSTSSFSTRISLSTVHLASGAHPPSLSPSPSTSASPSSIFFSSAASTSNSTLLPPLSAATDYPSTGLYYHNIHRRNHSAPLVIWNSAQAVVAAEIASSCRFAHNMSVSGGGYGQNLAAYGSTGAASLSPSLMLAKSITNQWYYGEVNSFLPSYYGEATPDMTYFSSWGHFSQVVWKGSSSVGCASQFCPSGTIFAGFDSWFTVCNYVARGMSSRFVAVQNHTKFYECHD